MLTSRHSSPTIRHAGTQDFYSFLLFLYSMNPGLSICLKATIGEKISMKGPWSASWLSKSSTRNGRAPLYKNTPYFSNTIIFFPSILDNIVFLGCFNPRSVSRKAVQSKTSVLHWSRKCQREHFTRSRESPRRRVGSQR